MDDCIELLFKHGKVLKKLKENQKQFETSTSAHLLDPHIHLFDEHGHLKAQGGIGAPVHGLMLGLIFTERILCVTSTLDTMLTRITQLEQARTKTKVWFPAGRRKLFSWAFGRNAAPGVAPVSSSNDGARQQKVVTQNKSESSHQKTSKKEKGQGAQEQLDQLLFHGGTKRSPSGKVLLAVTHWLGNTEGIFALRMLIVTIALALPAVVTSSAGFFYREKGLWALIMAQTGLLPYTADSVYGFAVRTIGTVVGGILGMVCWYIGADSGPGHPYGMAAIMALAIVLLMWLPPDLKARFARLSSALDDRFIGDSMAVLTLAEQSLKTGDALPANSPVPLIARCEGLNKAFAREGAGGATLSIESIRGTGSRKYCVVLSAFVQLLNAADDVVWRIETAVGETSYVDVEQHSCQDDGCRASCDIPASYRVTVG